jgi:HD superfamily phosphohydrolase YqeK
MLQNLTTASWDLPELLHGPAAAVRAWREGERDDSVLDAVRYHTVGWAGWDKVGHVLYMADYLEPGRPFRREERAALAARVPKEYRVVLREVARERMEWAHAQGWTLMGETEDFWHALAAGA